MKDVTKFTTVKINDTIRSKIIMTRTSNMIAELHKLHWIANRKKKWITLNPEMERTIFQFTVSIQGRWIDFLPGCNDQTNNKNSTCYMSLQVIQRRMNLIKKDRTDTRNSDDSQVIIEKFMSRRKEKQKQRETWGDIN